MLRIAWTCHCPYSDNAGFYFPRAVSGIKSIFARIVTKSTLVPITKLLRTIFQPVIGFAFCVAISESFPFLQHARHDYSLPRPFPVVSRQPLLFVAV